ncbi:hypothetical protein QUF70_18465, partial [Desulfobacterales bacterium HSG17]|nr:hypothetical protein [Desulfobacterales bacterium HSG17]
RRYKAISLKESDLKQYIKNANIILQTRKGFWGPFRLNKKVSLDNQRKNIKGVEGLVSINQELITEELEALIAGDQEIGSISINIETINSAFQQVLDNTENAKNIMDMEITDGLEEISTQGKMFGKKIKRIKDILNQVEKISFTMQNSILFNDMLPIVANMAALLVENKTDLLFRSQELDELLNKLKQAANSIEDFLEDANREVFHIREMYKQMISEININRKTSVNISNTLENVIKNLIQQPAQIKSVSSASEVIIDAIQVNRGFAEKINMEIEQLLERIKAYYGILDKRADNPENTIQMLKGSQLNS